MKPDLLIMRHGIEGPLKILAIDTNTAVLSEGVVHTKTLLSPYLI